VQCSETPDFNARHIPTHTWSLVQKVEYNLFEQAQVNVRAKNMKKTLAILTMLLIAHIARADSMIPIAISQRIGVKYTTPQEVSLPLGIVLAAGNSAILLEAEPGLHGGKINLGWGFVLPNAEDILFLKGSVLRTWDNPMDDVEPNTTYLGVELEFMGCDAIILNAGVRTRVGGNDNGEDTIISAGIGIAFWEF
jgi:hypothetical protein